MKILLLVPNMFSFKGGIQVFSKFFLEALSSFSEIKNIRVALLHDPPSSLPSAPSSTEFFSFGHIARKWRPWCFAFSCLYSILRRPSQLILTTHLHLSPVALAAKMLFGTPYGIVLHGVEAWNIRSRILRYALQKADLLISVSSFTEKKVLTQVPKQNSCSHILPNTFHEGHFQVQAQAHTLHARHMIPEERKIILTVARLDSALSLKGYDRILECLPSLIRKVPQAHYVLVGKGADKDRIEAKIQSLHIQDRVTLAGFVPDEELPVYYQNCDVFILPSTGEGFGIVFLEALACGRPCIGGSRDGSVDALGHGELGILVDPESANDIEDALQSVLTGESSHPLVYQAARLHEEVVHRFGNKAFRQKLFTILSPYLSKS